MAYKFSINQGEELLFKVAGISAAILGVVSAYTFYKNNIWHPKIEVLSVDFKDGVAKILINGKPITLKGDSSYYISQDWGIKFGYTFKGNGKRQYDRIEVLKKGMVHSVIKQAEGPETTSFVGDENMENGDWVYDTKNFVGQPKRDFTW